MDKEPAKKADVETKEEPVIQPAQVEEPEMSSAEISKEAMSVNPKDRKFIFIVTGVVILLFILAVGGLKITESFTGAAVLSVEELHQKNLAGELHDDRGLMYNGFSFVKYEGLWWTDLLIGERRVRVPLHFSPAEVQDIPVTGELDSGFNAGNSVYLAIDPTVVSGHYVVAMRELGANIAQGIGRDSIGACTTEHEGCEDREILSCDNTQGKPVIELAIAEEAGVELNGSCIKIKGTDYELLQATARLIYKWYQVMP